MNYVKGIDMHSYTVSFCSLQVLREIGAVQCLQEAAKRGSRLTGKFCCQALATCDVVPPPYQCWDVLRWTAKNVSSWVEDIGLKQLAPSFEEHLVTGNILVDLTMDDLLEIGFQSKVRCKWFLEEIRKLRCLADVSISKLEKDKVCKWLTKVSPNLDVYHVDFIRNGITMSILPYLTDNVLSEIGVSRHIDRLRILVAIGQLPHEAGGHDTPDEKKTLELKVPEMKLPLSHAPPVRDYDVYMCYRWQGGSQLASLIKVHLEVQGISVFMDVFGLRGGNFEDAIVSTLTKSRNVVLVLTPGSLDRCKGDTRIQDWLHREIVCAVDSKINIVPVVDPGFKWPGEGELPSDIRNVSKMNGVSWSHEFQDASVNRLIEFLKLPVVRGTGKVGMQRFDRYRSSLSPPKSLC